MTKTVTLEIIGLEQVPEKHRPVFRAVSSWSWWSDRPPAKEVAKETGQTHAAVLAAGRWLGKRVLVVTGRYSTAIAHGVRVERGRWICVESVELVVPRKGVRIVDLRTDPST